MSAWVFRGVQQGDGLGPVRCLGELLEEGAERRERGFGVVAGGEGQNVGAGTHPTGVVPGEVLRGLDLADLGGEFGGAVLQPVEAVAEVGRGGAVGHLDPRRLHRPFRLMRPSDLRRTRPEPGQRRVPGDRLVPPPRDRRRGVPLGSLERDRGVIPPGVVPRRRQDGQGRRRREPRRQPSTPRAPLGVEPRLEPRRAVRFGVSALIGRDTPGKAFEVIRGEIPEPFELSLVLGLQLLGEPAERPLQAERVKLGGGSAVAGAGSVRADGEDPAARGVPGEGVAGHPVMLIDEPLHPPGRRVVGFLGAFPVRPRQHPVELRQHQRHGAAGGAVAGSVDVPLQQVLDLLLPTPAVGGGGRPLGIEAEQDGVAVGEERLDRLVTAEGDVFPW